MQCIFADPPANPKDAREAAKKLLEAGVCACTLSSLLHSPLPPPLSLSLVEVIHC